LVILLWCIGIFWEIVVHFFPKSVIAVPLLKYNYSLVCHQQTEKLFRIYGYNTLVCSRCTGIYLGALFSSSIILFAKLKKVSKRIMIISSVPMFMDVTLYSSGLYSYSKLIALITGLILGSVGFLYIHDAVINILIQKKGKN